MAFYKVLFGRGLRGIKANAMELIALSRAYRVLKYVDNGIVKGSALIIWPRGTGTNALPFWTNLRRFGLFCGTIFITGSSRCMLPTAFAHGSEHQAGKRLSAHPTESEIALDKFRSDVCHMTPGLSDLTLDVIDLLQEKHKEYIRAIKKRMAELETTLKSYTSTLSINNLEASDKFKSQSMLDLSSSYHPEVEDLKREYRKTYQRSLEVVGAMEQLLSTSKKFGADSCVEDCGEKIQSAVYILNELDERARDFERKLKMAEQHYQRKQRRSRISDGEH